MGRGDRRKCKCCLKLFRPDPRNRRHQCYCSASGCRAASKAASQARWFAKPENQSYFRGPVNVARVQTWRARHQGSMCRPCVTRCLNGATPWFWCRNSIAARSPLQDFLTAQPAVLIGLIAHIVGTPLQMTSSAPRTVCYDWAKTFSLHPRRGRQRPRLNAEPVVINYETFCKIHDCHDRQGRW
jgi:hypothetical protein